MKNQPSIDDLTIKDWEDLWDLIIWETKHKVDYLEEDYRELQQDPRFCDPEEKDNLIKIRQKLWEQLGQRIDREDKIFEVCITHQQELIKTLQPSEIDNIAHNDLGLRYQLNELTETILRFDIELLDDRIKHKEYIPQTLLEIDQLITTAIRQKLTYLSKEIQNIQNYVNEKRGLIY